ARWRAQVRLETCYQTPLDISFRWGNRAGINRNGCTAADGAVSHVGRSKGHQPRLIGRLVRGDLLADILGAILEQSIHTLRQLASGRHDRFGRTGTCLDASVEG